MLGCQREAAAVVKGFWALASVEPSPAGASVDSHLADAIPQTHTDLPACMNDAVANLSDHMEALHPCLGFWAQTAPKQDLVHVPCFHWLATGDELGTFVLEQLQHRHHELLVSRERIGNRDRCDVLIGVLQECPC